MDIYIEPIYVYGFLGVYVCSWLSIGIYGSVRILMGIYKCKWVFMGVYENL